MDNKAVAAWLAAIIARGLAWIFAAKLGLDAAQADTEAATAANGIVALMLVGLSVYTSVKGRKKLLTTPPPKK